MELNRTTSNTSYQIKSYASGSITINEQKYDHPLILSADTLEAWNNFNSTQILELKPAVVLIGTGYNLPTAELESQILKISQDLNLQQIGVEIMNTAAACRTFTVLISENRKVVAALIP